MTTYIDSSSGFQQRPLHTLETARRIAGENADLFDVANKAVEEVRALITQWRDHIGARHLLGELEAIVERFDAAIKDAIK